MIHVDAKITVHHTPNIYPASRMLGMLQIMTKQVVQDAGRGRILIIGTLPAAGRLHSRNTPTKRRYFGWDLRSIRMNMDLFDDSRSTAQGGSHLQDHFTTKQLYKIAIATSARRKKPARVICKSNPPRNNLARSQLLHADAASRMLPNLMRETLRKIRFVRLKNDE